MKSDQFDLLIIGSGYGGSVMAARTAAALPGKTIGLLERGKRFLPGDFPSNTLSLIKEVKTRFQPLGLFDYKPTESMDILSANGLGGTSLINAAVMLRADAETFKLWPKDINSDSLQPFYEKAEAVLKPNSVKTSYPKSELMKELSKKSGFAFNAAPVAINFDSSDRKVCNGCGDCVTGCNIGAKNSLDHNYIRQAENNGCTIFTAIDVQNLSWDNNLEFPFKVKTAGLVYHAKKVVLSAGVTGSFQILNQSAATNQLPLSPTLGKHFSGNLDAISVSVDSNTPTSSLGTSTNKNPPGPTIMTYLEGRKEGKGFIIQDGSIPSALTGPSLLVALILLLLNPLRLFLAFKKYGIRLLSETVNNSQVFLLMGYDEAGGILQQKKGRLHIEWNNSGAQKSLIDGRKQLKKLNTLLGSVYLPNLKESLASFFPSATTPITVHALGGVPMGTSVENGVVDSYGRVFHIQGNFIPGLRVVDGSICRTSLGCNPSLTIAALAERSAEHLIAEFISEESSQQI